VPTLLSHPAVPLALRVGLGGKRVPGPLLAAAVAGSMLPDADVLGFRFGIAYGDLLGHRGLSHSLLAAAVVAALATLAWRSLGARPAWVFLVVLISTASHGLLDALTDGGLGVALLSPFDRTRYFLPWRPIAVSPIGIARFFSPGAWTVLWSECLWVWLPCVAAAGLLRLAVRTRPAGGVESA